MQSHVDTRREMEKGPALAVRESHVGRPSGSPRAEVNVVERSSHVSSGKAPLKLLFRGQTGRSKV